MRGAQKRLGAGKAREEEIGDALVSGCVPMTVASEKVAPYDVLRHLVRNKDREKIEQRQPPLLGPRAPERHLTRFDVPAGNVICPRIDGNDQPDAMMLGC